MSVNRKIAVTTMSALFIIAAVSMYFHYGVMQSAGREEIESLGKTTGPVVEKGLEDYMLSRDSDALERTLAALKNIKPIRRIRLIDMERVIKAGTEAAEIGSKLSSLDGQQLLGYESMQKSSLMESGKTLRWVQGIPNRPACYGCHGTRAKINGFIVVDFSTGELQKRIKAQIVHESLFFLVSFIMVGLAVFLISRSILGKRLNDVVSMITRFKEGEYSQDRTVGGNDEITRLEENFLDMAETIHRREREKNETEKEIGRNLDAQNVINTLLQISLENVPLEKILDRALDAVLSIPWLALESKGGIFLVEDTSDTLEIKAQKGLSSPLLKECGSVPFGRCLCGRAASTKELQFADTIDERHEIHYDDMVPHGHYCVPIIFSDRVLGVISLYLSEGHRRNEREVAFLKAIANVLAGIIQRKRVEDERETLISDLQVTLSKVSHSQRMWQETFDSIGDLISIHDSDFNIIKVNRAFASYFKLSPTGAIDKKCYEFFHTVGAPASNCPQLTTMRDGVPATAEFQDLGTKKIFLISTFPFYFHDANFHGSIHVAKDITEEREKEMRLIMSERLAALGQMASGIAHEINNPLAAIAGCAEGLLTRVKSGKHDPVLFENYLRIIEEEIMRCKGITTGMLSFVRKSTYERRAFSLNDITDKTIELVSFQGRLRNIEVVKTYADNMPPVEGNEGELRQVILIIIMNALDAMGDTGRLQIHTATEGRTAVLKVTDSGIGIPPENLSKIFDPFFTTKSDRGGTGLGLSIANKIVLSHNGTIYATSEQGRGSTFKIVLPLS